MDELAHALQLRSVCALLQTPPPPPPLRHQPIHARSCFRAQEQQQVYNCKTTTTVAAAAAAAALHSSSLETIISLLNFKRDSIF